MNKLAKQAYDNALKRNKIFQDDTHEAIFRGILDELCEFRNATELPSVHLPFYSERQEELADVLICCLTELHREGVNVEEIVTAKINFNKNR